MTNISELRAAKDEFFGSHHQSPIPHERRATFSGLSYYAYEPTLALSLAFAPGDGSTVTIGTSDGATRAYTRAGSVTFPVGQDTATLTLLATDNGLFLPFRDATSGKETYGAGRYLDLEQPVEGVIEIDFNLAYNPYCAYSDSYSCPLPPHENWLTVPIAAGEQSF